MDAVAALPEGVAWQFGDDEPAELAGRWTFAWDGRVQWFEEAEEVFVHARDPRRRVDVLLRGLSHRYSMPKRSSTA